MLLIVGTIRITPANLPEARMAMHNMISASREEHGCVTYSYAEDILEPGLIHVKEMWLDQPSLDKHFTTEHIAVWRATWPALGITNRNLSLYEVGEPQST